MKIKICRASGHPVNFEHQAAFQEDYRILYDKVIKKVGLEGTEMVTPEKADRINKLLERASRPIKAKYPVIGEIEFPKTKKAWMELIVKHGPIALAKTAENGNLAAIIMDASWEM